MVFIFVLIFDEISVNLPIVQASDIMIKVTKIVPLNTGIEQVILSLDDTLVIWSTSGKIKLLRCRNSKDFNQPLALPMRRLIKVDAVRGMYLEILNRNRL